MLVARYTGAGRASCLISIVLLTLALGACGGGTVRSLGNGSGPPTVTGNPPTPVTPVIPPPPPVPVVSVRISGTVTFDLVRFKTAAGMGLDLANPVVSPARGVTVEALASDGTTILGSVRTDATGGYLITVPGSTTVSVRVKAEMVSSGPPTWTVRVRNNTAGDALYSIATATFDTGLADSVHDIHAASGWDAGAMAYTSAQARQAAPFALLDDVLRAQTLVLGADGMAVFPPLDIFWSPGNTSVSGTPASGGIGSTHYDGTGTNAALYVLGDADIDTDEFDPHVVLSAWGQYYMAAFSRLDEPHSGAPGTLLDARAAFSGGFSTAIALMALNDPVYRNSYGAAQGSDLATNFDTAAATGWYDPVAVAALVYDIFDGGSADDDTVALGFAPLHTEVIGAVKTTSAFATVHPLLHALLADHAANAAGLKAIALARGIGDATGNVADDFGSDEIHDGGDAQNLPLYHTLTAGVAATNVCTNTAHGVYSGLGNRRFFRYDLAANGGITVTANGAGSPPSPNPDVVIYRAGLEVGRGATTGNESLTLSSMTAGTYVLDVYDEGNIQPGTPGQGPACIDVSVN